VDRNQEFETIEITARDREWVRSFVSRRWGADFVVAHGKSYFPHELPGFIAVDSSAGRLGLMTYCIENDALEVVTLDSVSERRGVGTALLAAARDKALEARCRKVWLITTNDNIDALRFYLKRGYRLVAVHLDALEVTRRLKPSLPERGEYDIPLCDELELELSIEID